MILNMTRGANLELDTVSATLSLTNSDLLIIQIPVSPLSVVLRTTVGSATELVTYWRHKPTDEFTMKAGSPAGIVTARVYGENYRSIFLQVSNVTAANPASFEYYIMGVKR